MKKVLEGEITSLAHSILKSKTDNVHELKKKQAYFMKNFVYYLLLKNTLLEINLILAKLHLKVLLKLI